jgi:CDP-paratose 2-epimerase
VYGDRPNSIGFTEKETRLEAHEDAWEDDYCAKHGFFESLSIDQSKHSLFGASKLAADILVQEYGRYFGMNTVAFRCGCLTGPAHQGTKLHGFLSYLVRCALTGTPYTVIGYNGKQVRDNLHSADLVDAFDQYIRNPRPGEVYNMGGGRENSCSVREAIALVERVTGKKMRIEYEPEPRIGDHKWWITDTRKFREHYPEWKVERGLEQIVREIAEANGHAG